MSKQSLAQLRKELREALPKVGKMDRDSVVAHLAKLGKPEKKEEVAVVEKKVEKVISPSEKKKPSAEVAAPAPARPAKGSPEMKEKMAKLREARLAKKSST